MKKIFLILSLFASACSISQNKQRQGEQTVKEYIHSKNPKVDTRDIKFTDLEPSGNIIGVIENKTIYDSNHRPIFIHTLYYVLNKDLLHVNGIYTN